MELEQVPIALGSVRFIFWRILDGFATAFVGCDIRRLVYV
jgi:hypothetical protein